MSICQIKNEQRIECQKDYLSLRTVHIARDRFLEHFYKLTNIQTLKFDPDFPRIGANSEFNRKLRTQK